MLLLRSTSALMPRALTKRVPTVCGYCKDYSSSDDEKAPKSKSKKLKKATTSEVKPATTAKEATAVNESSAPAVATESAVVRLNRLLASMPTEDSYTLSTKPNVAFMARPGAAHQKRKDTAKQEAESKDIFAAAKRIASLVGDSEQQQQTESELLAKLLGRDPATTDGNETDNMVQDGDGASKKSSSDLSLSELIVGMKIDRKQQPKEETRSEFVRRVITAKTQQQQQQQQSKQRVLGVRKERKREAETFTGSVNLFGCTPLGIFKDSAKLRNSTDMLNTWSQLEEHELHQQVARPPANYFEKIALWTEQGKVWRFPIDNEQDMVEEVNVDFSEHIFLEQHLEAWCPDKGPVRHFMELVCVGLSKNPYLTAKEKKEHILWYRDYFETKRDILKDLMSKEKTKKVTAHDKQLEA